MTNKSLRALAAWAVESDKTIRSYSGRGMAGRECVAFVTNNPTSDILEAGMFIGMCDGDAYRHSPTVATDNLGHDTIVYFPYVDWADFVKATEWQPDEQEDTNDDDNDLLNGYPN